MVRAHRFDLRPGVKRNEALDCLVLAVLALKLFELSGVW
jgi:phage terminase large subunit GpA-like protein